MLQSSAKGRKTVRRREFIALMGASVARPFAAMAQQAGRTYRVGVIQPFPRDASFNTVFLASFDAMVLSKAKTSRLTIAIFHQTSI
jgi:hypothetical protein